VDCDATLKVPADVAAKLVPGEVVHVILVVPDSSEDSEWQRLATDQLLRSYSDRDNIYDLV
jgi:hypothetical protein